MHLGDQGAGGVEDAQAPRRRLLADILGDAVGAEDAGGAARDGGNLVDEDGAAVLEIIDHEAVVDHLVADVNGGAEQLEYALDDVDGAVDAGAKAAGIGKQDVLGHESSRCLGANDC